MTTTASALQSPLDPRVCRRARLSRDSRFDGEFYLGVSTTGVFCRPICPARPPREANVSYFQTAAQATQAGYRPCLRCRPEAAPGSPAWEGSRTTVNRALRLIREGALNNGSITDLADRLGVGERYLRKLFDRELGVPPSQVAQTERLLFAKTLLTETELPITQIAFASGFGSVRRFNSFIREQMKCTPRSLRLQRQASGSAADAVTVELQLPYRAPLDWNGLLNYFDRHRIAPIESANGDSFQRSFTLPQGKGWFRAQDGGTFIKVQIQVSSAQALMPAVARLRIMFDLHARPADIAAAFANDPVLGPLIDTYPGIRSPVAWTPFEAAVRAVVGQQVSLAGASTVLGDIVERCDLRTGFGEGPSHFFPSPGQLLQLEGEALKMPRKRQQSLFDVCRYFASGQAESSENPWSDLTEIPGIGPWTASMVAMRGYGLPDAFPASDLVLLKTAEAQGIPKTTRAIEEFSQQWQPWRAYAANLLWRSASL